MLFLSEQKQQTLENDLFILYGDGEVIRKMKDPPNGFVNCRKAVVKNGELYYSTGNFTGVSSLIIMDIESLKVKFRNAQISFESKEGAV